MKIQVHQVKIPWPLPMNEPKWSVKVPRWYQLDGSAFVLCELFHRFPEEFDELIVASPLASNHTDWDFVQGGCQRAQKFVHTLPNVRASMALQVLDRVCPVICLQNGQQTLFSGFLEFFERSQEKRSPALAFVDAIESKDGLGCFFQASLIVKSDFGNWEMTIDKEPTTETFPLDWHQLLNGLEGELHLGPWRMEKLT